MVDFLVRAAVACYRLVRKTMGKGNSIDKRHGMKKETPEW
jgi:DNA-nicking Smr family endonuclease